MRYRNKDGWNAVLYGYQLNWFRNAFKTIFLFFTNPNAEEGLKGLCGTHVNLVIAPLLILNVIEIHGGRGGNKAVRQPLDKCIQVREDSRWKNVTVLCFPFFKFHKLSFTSVIIHLIFVSVSDDLFPILELIESLENADSYWENSY